MPEFQTACYANNFSVTFALLSYLAAQNCMNEAVRHVACEGISEIFTYTEAPPKHVQVVASKKGAMRALGRVVRSDEAANEVVAAGGLVPIVKLLDCNDPGVVRRYTTVFQQWLIIWSR